MLKQFEYHHPFILESGRLLNQFHLGYTTHGRLNEHRDNVIWVFHALTANSDPAEWWSGLVGEGKYFDPAQNFIICVNMPGSCYGSICPTSINEESGNAFYHDFPLFTTRDMIRAYQKLKDSLGIKKIKVGIGGSMGGQQLLEWAIEEPSLFEYIIPIATNAKHSPWGIAFNATQRLCIEQDITWLQKHHDAGKEGMKVARAIALLSYRNYHTYDLTQQGYTSDVGNIFKAETYQRYQGEKLARRFKAFSYYFLSKSMDTHDVGRGRGGAVNALAGIKAKTLVVGIRSDLLFPVSEQEFLATHIPSAALAVIDSDYGHDGFLLEFEQLVPLIDAFKRKSLLELDYSNG